MCVRVIEWWKAINKEVFAKRFTHYVNVEENDRMIYACKACYGAFSYKDNRNGARTFPHCKKYFTNKKCMYNHVESINGTLTEVMQANMCSENCYDIRKALKSTETLPCPACYTALKQRKAVLRHVREIHHVILFVDEALHEMWCVRERTWRGTYSIVIASHTRLLASKWGTFPMAYSF